MIQFWKRQSFQLSSHRRQPMVEHKNIYLHGLDSFVYGQPLHISDITTRPRRIVDLRIQRFFSPIQDGTIQNMDKIPPQYDNSVNDFIASLDDYQTAKDCLVLIEMMQRISGHEPKMWNVGTLGFDSYHYKYDSGREGDGHVIGFYPRKGKITIYLMDGTVRYYELLAKLGKHTTTGYCIYIKRLSDIELPILEQILQKSYEYIKSQDGHIHQVLWRTATK